MASRTLSFDFYKTTGVNSGVARSALFGYATGGGAYLNSYLRFRQTPAFGRLICTNGWNRNVQMPWGSGLGSVLSNNNALTDLIMPPPIYAIMPLTTKAGAGRIFGLRYKWRWRWLNTLSGDVSGLSAVPPQSLDMGTSLTGGNVMGQNAHFYFDASTAPAMANAIQLFRNTSGSEDVWYTVDTKLIAGASYVYFKDDKTDEELLAAGVTSDLNVNPGFDEGTIPPVVKSYEHSIGRVLLFGLRRMGPYRAGTVSATAGTVVVTRTDTTTCFGEERIGQRFRFKKNGSATTIQDTTTYRIVDVKGDGSTLYVTPPIAISSSQTSGAYTSTTYEIVDDRDGRALYMSEPGKPTCYDLLNTIYIGADRDDDLLHVWQMQGATWAQTRRRIYRLTNFETEDPANSVIIQIVASEGTTGFDSGCLTPLGWVYLHPTLGVRVFNGQSPPKPLGSESSVSEFLPKQQFQGAETDAYSAITAQTYTGADPAFLSNAILAYDPTEHLIHFFYVPNGSWDLNEEMTFDPATGSWRGPWRRNCTATGTMRNADGTEVFVFGDSLGNLWLDNQQNVDLFNGGTGTAAASTSGDYYVLANSGAPFDAATWKEQGVPVLLTSLTGSPTQTLQRTRIVDLIDSSTAVLENSTGLASGTWTYRLGAIRWAIVTAFLDAGEMILPKVFRRLRTRFRRPSASASTASIGVLLDGETSISSATGAQGAVQTLDPSSKAHYDLEIMSGSRLAGVVSYGTSTTCDPQITAMAVDVELGNGA